MKILILGGTAFVGRVIANEALARGHELTLFNRGQRNPDVFLDVEQIHGDRLTDLGKLSGRKWDAVIDTSAYFPRAVSLSTQQLKDQTDQYLFISTISVFKNLDVLNQAEDSELATVEDPAGEQVTGVTYGGLKVLCENVVKEEIGERALIVRPGLIIGPIDYTDRFTYWPVRMSQGGDVLVPDLKNQPVQMIDARDLANFCLDCLEKKMSGTFNATGPLKPYTLEEMLTSCAEGTDANLVWVDPEFLTKHEVKPWADLPMVVDFSGHSDGMLHIDVSKAVSAGLKQRSLAETVQDTRAWALARPSDYVLKAGLARDRECEILEAWNKQ